MKALITGASSGIGRDMETRAECSHEDTDDDRTSGDTKFHRHADARDGNRNASENETQDDAYEHRQEVRILQLS